MAEDKLLAITDHFCVRPSQVAGLRLTTKTRSVLFYVSGGGTYQEHYFKSEEESVLAHRVLQYYLNQARPASIPSPILSRTGDGWTYQLTVSARRYLQLIEGEGGSNRYKEA